MKTLSVVMLIAACIVITPTIVHLKLSMPAVLPVVLGIALVGFIVGFATAVLCISKED